MDFYLHRSTWLFPEHTNVLSWNEPHILEAPPLKAAGAQIDNGIVSWAYIAESHHPVVEQRLEAIEALLGGFYLGFIDQMFHAAGFLVGVRFAEAERSQESFCALVSQVDRSAQLSPPWCEGDPGAFHLDVPA